MNLNFKFWIFSLTVDIDGEHPPVVFVSSKGPSADIVQDGFGIYKIKQELRQNKKPVWKHVNRDIYIFFNGGF